MIPSSYRIISFLLLTEFSGGKLSQIRGGDHYFVERKTGKLEVILPENPKLDLEGLMKIQRKCTASCSLRSINFGTFCPLPHTLS